MLAAFSFARVNGRSNPSGHPALDKAAKPWYYEYMSKYSYIEPGL
jgi:hypothetical protein